MEGGVIVTDDETHETMLVLRAHGWTRNLPKLIRLRAKRLAMHLKASTLYYLVITCDTRDVGGYRPRTTWKTRRHYNG